MVAVLAANFESIRYHLAPFAVRATAEPSLDLCDALVFDAEVEIDDQLLRDFNLNGRPIAAISARATLKLAQVFNRERPTLAAILDSPKNSRPTDLVYWEACAADDFVTDRDYRLISTSGLTPRAIEKALGELANLA